MSPLGGADFDVSGFPVTVTLFPDMTSVNVTVTTTADGVIECTECFNIVLGIPASSSELGVKQGHPPTVTTCIMDADDSKFVYVCECVCVCVCVCACACVCVCVCVCMCM